MSNITLTIPNDDHIALRAFGKALEEMALAHGAEPVPAQVHCNVTMNDEQNEQLRQKLKNVLGEPRDGNIDVTRAMVEECAPIIDTTAQQVESLATNVVDRTIDLPEPTVSDATADSTGTPWDERIHSASKALNTDGTWRLRRKPKDMDELEWSDYVSMIKADLQYPVECGGEDPEQYVEDLTEVQSVDPVACQNAIEVRRAETEQPEPPVTPPGDDFHTDAGVVTEQTVAGIPPIPVPPPVTEWQNEVTHPESGDLCSVCMKPQFSSPSGVTCENGHGGAPAYEKPVPPPVVVPPVPAYDFPGLMKFLTERHGRITVEQVNALLAVDGLAALTDLNAHPDKIGPFVARVKAHLGE